MGRGGDPSSLNCLLKKSAGACLRRTARLIQERIRISHHHDGTCPSTAEWLRRHMDMDVDEEWWQVLLMHRVKVWLGVTKWMNIKIA